MKSGFARAVIFIAFSGALPAFAHHSFAAEFDAARPVELKGKLSKVEWTNPHVYFYIDVADAQGKVITWACESTAPAALTRRGLRRDDMKPGDKITVTGYLAKDGSRRIKARNVTLPDGRVVSHDAEDYGK